MSKIYLFTLSFPFGYGETFLENEVAVAYQMPGTQVILVPFMIKSYMRSLPDGISVDTSLAEIISASHEKKIYPLIPHFVDILKGLHKHKCKSFSAIRDVAGVVHHGRLIQRWGAEKLQNGDVAYTYWFDRITYGLAKLKAEKKIAFSLVSRVHRYDIYAELRRHRFIPFRKYILSMVDCIFSISEDGRNYLLGRYSQSIPDLPEKVVVSRLGVLDHGLNPSGTNEQLIKFVSCSTIIKVKKVDRIAHLLIEYAKSNPGKAIEWEHFGGGALQKDLSKQVKNAPANLTINLHGQVTNSDIIEFYKNNFVSAFINLSASEGIPVSIMEAQSFGIPVLARDVGGNREIVNDQNGYLLTRHYDIHDAISALDQIVLAPEKRLKARELFIKNYFAGTNYKGFYMHLNKLLGSESKNL